MTFINTDNLNFRDYQMFMKMEYNMVRPMKERQNRNRMFVKCPYCKQVLKCMRARDFKQCKCGKTFVDSCGHGIFRHTADALILDDRGRTDKQMMDEIKRHQDEIKVLEKEREKLKK